VHILILALASPALSLLLTLEGISSSKLQVMAKYYL